MGDKVKIRSTLGIRVRQLRSSPMTHPKVIPNVLQPLKVRPQWLRVLRQVIHSLSYGVLVEHGKNLGDRTPIHSLSRPTTRFDDNGRIFRNFVKLRVPFKSVPPFLRLFCR